MMNEALEDEIAERTKIAPSVVRHVVAATFDIISERLANGESVARRNFGAFEVLDKPSRSGKHPRTGQEIVIAARRLPRFRPYAALRKSVEQSERPDGAG